MLGIDCKTYGCSNRDVADWFTYNHFEGVDLPSMEDLKYLQAAELWLVWWVVGSDRGLGGCGYLRCRHQKSRHIKVQCVEFSGI